MIIVTGAAGQIGRAVVTELVSQGLPVCGIDIIAKPDSLDDSIAWITADLTQLPSDFAWPSDASITIHLAGAVTTAPLSFASVQKWMSANLLTTANLLATCANMRRFVYVSSISVYGDSEGVPWTEEAPTKPVTGYGISKLLGEMVCHHYFADAAQDIFVILRLAQVYGPGTLPQNALYRLIRQAIDDHRLDLTCTSGLRRDYIHISDAVKALIVAAQMCPAGVYNVGCGYPFTMGDLVGAIVRAVPGCAAPQFMAPGNAKEYPVALSTERFAAATGFRPGIPIAQGVAWEVARLTVNSSSKE